ncbi:MAG: acetate/propionate family kinase [Actinobacteria bacterium]|nr:acetate/propionate family kinase [Actinomycetota bacterium]
MRILVVNAGSSSLKLQILQDEELVVDLNLQRWSPAAGFSSIRDALADHGEIDAVGHRVVHGGTKFGQATLITDSVVAYLESTVDLAPLHQPPALAAIAAARELLPGVPQIACFDTAFHRSIPAAAATYALPREWNKRWGLRRYGFHGLSHAYACGRAAELVGREVSELRMVTAHLGAGGSLAAIDRGRSIDTTMGFTPLEGLVMATRSGSVDPGLVLWLQSNAGYSVEEIGESLAHLSGLAGLSGTDGDLRDVLGKVDQGDKDARLAIDVYNHRLASLTGSMVTSLRGLDVLAFTGGIGENADRVRTELANALAYLGVDLDDEANANNGTDRVITLPTSKVAIVVVAAREDLQIASEVTTVLEST